MDLTLHLCFWKETCSLRQLMRDHPYKLLFPMPQLPLTTTVAQYGAVVAVNKTLAHCGDFVKITDGVSNSICNLEWNLLLFILSVCVFSVWCTVWCASKLFHYKHQSTKQPLLAAETWTTCVRNWRTVYEWTWLPTTYTYLRLMPYTGFLCN